MKRAKTRYFLLATALTAAGFSACNNAENSTPEEKAGNRAIAFAQAYYNQHYDKATQMATPESRKWITFFVSNINESDLEVLRQYPDASIASLQEIVLSDDTTATATLVVDYAFVVDSLDKPGHMEENKQLSLRLVNRDNEWLVSLDNSL